MECTIYSPKHSDFLKRKISWKLKSNGIKWYLIGNRTTIFLVFFGVPKPYLLEDVALSNHPPTSTMNNVWELCFRLTSTAKIDLDIFIVVCVIKDMICIFFNGFKNAAYKTTFTRKINLWRNTLFSIDIITRIFTYKSIMHKILLHTIIKQLK